MTKDPKTGSTREAVLRQIRTAPEPPTVEEIATALDLHPNSVRLHAAALREARLITQTRRVTGGRGRPLVAYRPTSHGARSGARNFEVLAEALVDHLAATEDDAPAASRQAGMAWGARLATRGRDQTVRHVPDLLTELGFEPDQTGTTITLRNCPFRELVDSHQDLVCSLHAGMLEGLVDGGPAAVTLTPFSTPSTCTVDLGRE